MMGRIVALAAVAGAAGAGSPVNQYSVHFSVPGERALALQYKVGEKTGRRPDVVERYGFAVEGLRPHLAGLRAGAKVGHGSMDGVVGPSNDPNQKTGSCHLGVSVFKAGARSVVLRLQGGPYARACVATVKQDVSAQLVPDGNYARLSFRIPS